MRLRGSRYTEGESTLLHFRFSIHVKIKGGTRNSNPFSANFKVSLTRHGPSGVLRNLCCDFIALIPRGRVRGLDTGLPTTKLGDLLVTMPKIEALGLPDVLLSEGLLQKKSDGPYAGRKLLPSLRSMLLKTLSRSTTVGDPLRYA